MYISPTRSALIMSLEATFSAFLAFIFLHEVLSVSELVGCGLMFTATLLSTTASVEDDEDDSQSVSEQVKALDPMSPSHLSRLSKAANGETSVLEHYLVTKQRTLHRHIVLRRSRSRSLTSPIPVQHDSEGEGGSDSWRGWINENTQLLHADGDSDPSGLGCIPSTADYGSV